MKWLGQLYHHTVICDAILGDMCRVHSGWSATV